MCLLSESFCPGVCRVIVHRKIIIALMSKLFFRLVSFVKKKKKILRFPSTHRRGKDRENLLEKDAQSKYQKNSPLQTDERLILWQCFLQKIFIPSTSQPFFSSYLSMDAMLTHIFSWELCSQISTFSPSYLFVTILSSMPQGRSQKYFNCIGFSP